MKIGDQDIQYCDLLARPELWAMLEAEMGRLQTIVDALPKTADGVPVTFGRHLYSPLLCEPSYAVGGGHASGVLAEFRDVRVANSRAPGAFWSINVTECYSTREAAEAAKEKPSPSSPQPGAGSATHATDA